MRECPVDIRVAGGPKATERGAEEEACKHSAAGGQAPDDPASDCFSYASSRPQASRLKPESRVAANYAAIKNGFRAIFSYALLPLLSPKKLTLSGGPEEK